MHSLAMKIPILQVLGSNLSSAVVRSLNLRRGAPGGTRASTAAASSSRFIGAQHAAIDTMRSDHITAEPEVQTCGEACRFTNLAGTKIMHPDRGGSLLGFGAPSNVHPPRRGPGPLLCRPCPPRRGTRNGADHAQVQGQGAEQRGVAVVVALRRGHLPEGPLFDFGETAAQLSPSRTVPREQPNAFGRSWRQV